MKSIILFNQQYKNDGDGFGDGYGYGGGDGYADGYADGEGLL